MNSIEDFTALRPEAERLDDAALDALWGDIVSAPADLGELPDAAMAVMFDPEASDGTPGDQRRGVRRFALLGAAAAFALGVVGTALVLDNRTATAPPVQDGGTTLPTEVSPAVVTTAVDEALGPVPQWQITAPGWTLTEFAEVENRMPAGSRASIVAGEPGAGWTVVYPSSGDVLPPVPEPEGRAFDVMAGVGVGPYPLDDALTMNWGGFFQVEAIEGATVALGGSEDGTIHQALSPSAPSDMARSWVYRLSGPDGQGLRVEVRGGGVPLYDDLSILVPPEPVEAGAGVDDAQLLWLGNGTLIMRTGFWVTTVEPVEVPASIDEAAEITGLVELVPVDERIVAPAPDGTAAPRAEPDRDDAPVVSEPVDPQSTDVDSLAIGDSVMLGAAEELAEAGFVVDAQESRSFVNALELVELLAEQERLPRTAVLHLGNNGAIPADQMDRMMELLAAVDVVLITIDIDRDYRATNNALMFAFASRYPNVEVLDWDALADSCEGDCFEADGFHLRPDGRRYYVEVIDTMLADG